MKSLTMNHTVCFCPYFNIIAMALHGTTCIQESKEKSFFTKGLYAHTPVHVNLTLSGNPYSLYRAVFKWVSKVIL